jgi:hypothetical protein
MEVTKYLEEIELQRVDAVIIPLLPSLSRACAPFRLKFSKLPPGTMKAFPSITR